MRRFSPIHRLTIGVVASGLLLMPLLVFALCHDQAGKDDPYCVKEFAGYTGLTTTTSLPLIIGNVIRMLLLLTGVIFFLFFFWAGFRWMTARGNQEIVDESRRIMENLALGLAVILISYAFTTFMMNQFFK